MALRYRAEPGNEFRELIELDISRIHVGDVDAEGFESGEDAFDVRPMVFEGHRFHFLPVGPDFGRVIGRSIEIRASKIQAKRWADDGHFDGQKIVVVAEQQRHSISANMANIKVLQSEKDAQFPVVRDFPVVEFDRDLVGWFGRLGWKIDDVYTTLSSHAQP